MNKASIGLLAAVIAAFCFGASNPHAKLAADGTDPVMLSFFVTLIASAAFAAYVLLKRGAFSRLDPKDAPLYLALGLAGHAVPSLLSLYGLTKTNALSLLFLLRSEIFFATIFGVLIYKERVNAKQLMGIFIGFFGVFVFATEFNFTGINFGDLLIITATIFWAAYVVIVRKLSDTLNPVTIASLRAWIALPFLAAAAIAFNSPLAFPKTQYFNIGFFAVFTYVFGVVAYNHAIERLGVWKAAIPTQLLSIVFGSIATWLVLGETLSALKFAGGAMIIGGTVLALSGKGGQDRK